MLSNFIKEGKVLSSNIGQEQGEEEEGVEGEMGVFRRTPLFTESCLIFNASSESFQNQALNNPKPNSREI